MKCEKCGNEYNSQYYFATPSICKDCFSKLPSEEQDRLVNQMTTVDNFEEFPFRVGFGRRLGAALIDFVIWTIIFIILFSITGVSEEAKSILNEAMVNPAAFQELDKIMAPLILISWLAYFSTEIFFAATPGKMVLGIKIADEERQEAGMGTLFTRFIIKHIDYVFSVLTLLTAIQIFSTVGSVLSLLIVVGFFFTLAPKRQAFHDMLAKTAVYYREDVINQQ